MKPLFAALSPAGANARLSILIFHRVLPRPDPLFPGEVDAERFDAICGWLKAWFDVLPLDDAVRRLREGRLPARALAITFDDGYADNHDVALPVLRRHGLAATFFIASGFLDGGRMWNDTVVEAVRRTALPEIDLRDLGGLADAAASFPVRTAEERRTAIERILPRAKYLPPDDRLAVAARIAERAAADVPRDLMLTTAQLRALHRAGMQIGAHTVTHPILAGLDDAAAFDEIAASRRRLEAALDAPVALFAYPNGRPGADYTGRTVALARAAGFDAAVTTGWGAAHAATDAFELPRFTPWDRSKLAFGARLARNLWSSRPRRGAPDNPPPAPTTESDP